MAENPSDDVDAAFRGLVVLIGLLGFVIGFGLGVGTTVLAWEPEILDATITIRCMLELADGDSTMPVHLAADICWPLNVERPESWSNGPARMSYQSRVSL